MSDNPVLWVAACVFLVLAIVGSLVYSGAKTADCYGRGALVNNAWGGLDCVPVVK